MLKRLANFILSLVRRKPKLYPLLTAEQRTELAKELIARQCRGTPYDPTMSFGIGSPVPCVVVRCGFDGITVSPCPFDVIMVDAAGRSFVIPQETADARPWKEWAEAAFARECT